MSKNFPSAEYFKQVAVEWDNLRAGYFTDSVRAAALRKAYLRPEHVVADVGAGTGFMAAGIAPIVRQVYVLDASPAMLAVAQENLRDFNNVVFQEADGSSLPLSEASLDVVFANMYLHHCPDPQAAIREMARVLRPGGRLVITDLDSHQYSWLTTEMADVWQGFDRAQIREWFQQAGLVNVIVDCTGESCCAAPQNSAVIDPDERQAQISIFVAVGTRRVLGVQEAVRSGYGAAAESDRGCCPSPADGQLSACCSPDQLISLETILEPQFMRDYRPEELAQAPQEAVEFSLGCGNPLAFAGLQTGEAVLDIGSGGGMDAFISARKVGITGQVIGVDMTPAMLERARRTADIAGLTQVEFRQGQAEALPVEDGMVDVVISNCVINLCEDKGKVFREAYRVLKAGGRLEVSDVVTNQAFPREMIANAADWAGCVFGALPEQEYLDLVAQAGFGDVVVRRSPAAEVVPGVTTYSIIVSARKSIL